MKLDDYLNYQVVGTGEPVLLLHGFTGTRQTWKEIEKYLKEYQLILVDLPGHGQTRGFSLTSMKACCQQLAILLKKLNIDKVHIVGYSMGGRTAIHFANDFPEMVHTLTLESASPGLVSAKERQQRQEKDKGLANSIMNKGIEEFVDYWEQIPLFASQQNLSSNKQQQIRKERLSQQPGGLAHSLRTMGTGMQPSFWNELSRLSLKVLLVVGEYDSKFIRINEQMSQKFPNADLIVCKQVGHAVHVEKPEIFGKIVEEFLHRNPIIK